MPATATTTPEAPSPLAAMPAVTVPMTAFVPDRLAHYFCGRFTGAFTKRAFLFPGDHAFTPLVRAFLDTCVAEHGADHRSVFALLGLELAKNAIDHTRSGGPENTYRLLVERTRTHTLLTCYDDGDPGPRDWFGHRPLAAVAPDPMAERGRGLALVDALSSRWGDSGRTAFRSVWFRLDHTR
ncbi:ATP-binding protein [Nocardiopsis ansamitocini]|uniref:Histidine kinase/HSP90-like ATPase domain-containing protein n=1 Tax=Nocardiopsis ansamitocini TaxID=1670832 RepID=A0A9W6P7D5_9ACTN|nr:ATP-binding protein [Nocardiopsis ansamitocini]GLU48382.1 hypothetical protein Nans01_27330 [Nocardiopsis ansamitocini]